MTTAIGFAVGTTRSRRSVARPLKRVLPYTLPGAPERSWLYAEQEAPPSSPLVSPPFFNQSIRGRAVLPHAPGVANSPDRL